MWTSLGDAYKLEMKLCEFMKKRLQQPYKDLVLLFWRRFWRFFIKLDKKYKAAIRFIYKGV